MCDTIKKQIETYDFNKNIESWKNNIPRKDYDIVEHLIERLQVCSGHSVLDVATGTGILYSILKDKNLANYVAIDISTKMVEEFKNIYNNADVRCADFETTISLEKSFDYVITYNSIPHFNNLDMLFQNAFNNLNNGGKFIIAHSKTREGIKEHHKNIGYESNKEPIPLDSSLIELCEKYNFTNIILENSEYFFFSCEK